MGTFCLYALWHIAEGLLKLGNQLFFAVDEEAAYRCAAVAEMSELKSNIKHHTFFGGISNIYCYILVHVLPSAGLSPRAAEIIERVGLLWTERR